MQHGTTPHDGLVLVDEKAHRDAADAVGHRRDQQVAEQGRGAVDAQHGGDREAVDVRIENPHRGAPARKSDREVDGHGRLADSTLTRGDRDHPRVRRLVGEGVGGVGPSAPCGAGRGARDVGLDSAARRGRRPVSAGTAGRASHPRPSSWSLARSSSSSASVMSTSSTSAASPPAAATALATASVSSRGAGCPTEGTATTTSVPPSPVLTERSSPSSPTLWNRPGSTTARTACSQRRGNWSPAWRYPGHSTPWRSWILTSIAILHTRSRRHAHSAAATGTITVWVKPRASRSDRRDRRGVLGNRGRDHLRFR